ncbi:MAG: hypothetical protein K9J12_01135 [Melioribacteraceae bacterium]|nr:hypothetical protein [Melioribacteraceae bacterium]MCF8263934.1 hypothetical protein [Melioribacteraceae bacterium]
MNKNYKILLLIPFLVGLIQCTDKFDTALLSEYTDGGNVNFGDTVYIPQSPDWEGFNNPQDMIIGKEQFVYIADTDNDQVVMMDLSGKVLGSTFIEKPVALDQDFRKDLIVCGALTHTNGQIYSAVFKIRMVDAAHQIANAKIDTLLPKSSFDFLRADRNYTGVASFYDNRFYIGRTGTKNSNPIDPDNIVMDFRIGTNRKDSLTGRVPNISAVATGIPSANGISSLSSFNNSTLDFIITLVGDNSFKVQWLEYQQTDDFTGYRSKLQAFSSELMMPNRFSEPQDVALDPSGNIYVADAAKDSILIFNSFGDELQSFGGPESFIRPHAVAYYDRTLYVLDTGNNRILRFILSTEID